MILKRMEGIFMVLKKPYAFIIKHFRAIHLLLLIPIFYLIIKTRAIFYFFNSYVSYGYSINFSEVLTNISSEYINILMYIAFLLVFTAYFLFIKDFKLILSIIILIL